MKKLILSGLLFSSIAAGAPIAPMAGGTGKNNNDLNTITLGGAILTQGAFTTAGAFAITGAFSTTIQVSATTVVTLPSGTHTLASSDGTNASGTWPINITGTSAGAPPTGSAGGDLTGTYPSPTLGTNVVTNAKFRQSSATSVVGNSTGSTANVNDISSSADGQVLRQSGGTLTFGSIDLSQSATVGSSVLGQTNGGTNAASYGASRIIFQNSGNTAFSSDAGFLYSGGLMTLASGSVSAPTATSQLNINSSTQASARITLSGQEFWQASNTGNDGVSLLLGVNRAGNRQLWIASSVGLTQNSTNRTIRIQPNSGAIDSMATDGTTALSFTIGQTGAATTVNGSTTTIAGGAVSVTGGDFDVTRSSSGQIIGLISNTNNASGSAGAKMQIKVGGASAGDPVSVFTTSGVQDWGMGIDNSANDQFVIASADTLGSSDRLRITTGGDITDVVGNFIIGTNGKTINFPAADADKILFLSDTAQSKIDTTASYSVNFRSGNTASANTGAFNWMTSGASGWSTRMTLSNVGSLSLLTGDFDATRSSTGEIINKLSNTNNASGSAHSKFQAMTGGASGGDPKYVMTISGVQDWAAGVDNSVNDQYVISASDTPGSSDRLQITTSGDITDVSGDLIIGTANKGLTIKSAAVSAGTANAAIITGVTLSSGTVTINDSYINTSTVCYFSVVTASGTPGIGGYRITVGSGTVQVDGAATDNSSGNIACLKGN